MRSAFLDSGSYSGWLLPGLLDASHRGNLQSDTLIKRDWQICDDSMVKLCVLSLWCVVRRAYKL